MKSKVNSEKLFVCVIGYALDVLVILSAFLLNSTGKTVLISYVAILVITCVIIKLIKQDEIKDSMSIFVGKWSFYVSTFAIGIILELIFFAFEVDFIGKVLDKIEK